MELKLDSGYYDAAHEISAKLRADGPAHRVEMNRGIRFWVIAQHAQAQQALADPRLSKDIRGLGAIIRRQLGLSEHDPLPAIYRNTILYQDRPGHTQHRSLVTKAFTPRRIERLRPRIAQLTNDLVRALPRDREIDLIKHLAGPLPLSVICELLGIPAHTRESLRAWTLALVEEDADRGRAYAATQAMDLYLARLLNDKRAEPGEDLISALLQDDVDGSALSDEQVIATVILLILAGHDTTTNLLGNAVYHLLDDPSRWALLRAQPELIPGAIHELIRFDAPVAMATHRFTVEPVSHGDVEIPVGELVLVSLLSAGRDNTRFPDADTLDLHRDAAGHLGFGHGPHYCLGARLALLEAEIVLGALLEKFPNARLARDAAPGNRQQSFIMHGFTELLVELG